MEKELVIQNNFSSLVTVDKILISIVVKLQSVAIYFDDYDSLIVYNRWYLLPSKR